MANRIKGITVEIGGDTTKLQNALKGVNTQIKSTESQLRDVNKLLKLDPGNTELIAQKHRLLGDAVNETKEKLTTLKAAAEQANEALAKGEISQEQYDALQREIVETENELKNLTEAANESGTALQKIAADGEKLKTMGDKVSGVGEKMMPVTLAITGVGAAAVKTAADFDSSMSKVAAVSGATGSDFDSLRDKAREMGAKTKFSASEAAEAMNYMAMAGWKTTDMLSGIEGVMNLAAASGEELGTTSDIVTDALTAFGLTAQDSGHFADVLAAASSNANTNVSMMGETFKYAAPIAGALGYSVEDTAEAIGLMANAGIKSSQAGTSLRKIMTELNGEIKISGENLGDVAIQTSNADGSMRSFGDIIADCRGAFSQLTESEQAATAETLVGKTAMSGFLALMNAAPSDIAKLETALSDCDGTAEKMALTMQDNLEGQLTILKSQLQELAISFGDLLMPAIRQIVTWIQGFVDKLNSMDDGTRKVIITIALLVAAIAPVLIVVGKVMSAIGTMMTIVPQIAGAIGALKGAFAALNAVMMANPIGLIVAAIAALVAAFIYLWNTSESFRQFWIGLWEGIKSVVSTAVEGIKNFFMGVVSFFKENWQEILLFIVSPFAGAFKLLYDNCTGFREFVDGFLSGVKELFSTIWGGLVDVVSGIWQSISDTVGGFMSNIWQTITGVWQSIMTTLSPLLEAFRYLFETIFQAVQILIGMALDAIKTKLETIWNGIVSFLTPLLNGLKAFIETIWNGISVFLGTILNGIKTVYMTIWNAIKTAITTIVNAIKGVLTSVWNSIKGTITSIMNAIKSSVLSIWNNVKSGISNVIRKIYDVIHGGMEKAANYIKSLASKAFSWGRDMIMGIVNGINSVIGSLTSAVTNVANKIREVLHFSVPDKGPLTDYESWMPDFIEGLAKGINKSRGMIQKAMAGVTSDMVINPSIGNIPLMTSSNGAGVSQQMETMKAAMAEILSDHGSRSGDLYIPVYIGQERIDEIVVRASQAVNYRSGGR